jgi:tetratricopeptide (TPR) repeat protein
LLGVAYETKGLRDRAFESFEKALKGDENNAEYLNNRGFLHFKNGNYDKAAKYVKQAVKVAPQTQRYLTRRLRTAHARIPRAGVSINVNGRCGAPPAEPFPPGVARFSGAGATQCDTNRITGGAGAT